MFLFLERWKRERREKILQINCPHEYHIVSTKKVDVGTRIYIWEEHHDLYCPHCNLLMEKVEDKTAKRILEMQKVREESGTIISYL